jgi:hypothetical protein
MRDALRDGVVVTVLTADMMVWKSDSGDTIFEFHAGLEGQEPSQSIPRVGNPRPDLIWGDNERVIKPRPGTSAIGSSTTLRAEGASA